MRWSWWKTRKDYCSNGSPRPGAPASRRRGRPGLAAVARSVNSYGNRRVIAVHGQARRRTQRAQAGVSVTTPRRRPALPPLPALPAGRNAARDGEGRRVLCELTERDTNVQGVADAGHRHEIPRLPRVELDL